ncbi:sigma-54 interaction domain-containing protein [Brevibacillus massiliensis]|uniref:sigma-54 interaction domain-containing protein n=1 Tax=Brevibacillus massiliensis TaxID=1118054 RepID=UPI0002FC7036|nr:sigma 54-interacting transcriptional regulator [Brevibacillus massiliensis]
MHRLHPIQKNFTTIPLSQWESDASVQTADQETLILLLNTEGQIEGAVSKCQPKTIIPVGSLSLNSIPDWRNDTTWENYSVFLVYDETGQIEGWIGRDDLYRFFFQQARQACLFYEKTFASFPFQVEVRDERGQLFYSSLGNQDATTSLVPLQKSSEKHTEVNVTENKQAIVIKTNIMENHRPLGEIQLYWDTEEIEKIAMSLDNYVNLALDLKAVFDSSYDVIYVSDDKGITMRVSSACERLFGLKAEELIGKSVYELEKRGIFKPSITRMVLEKKEKVQVIQTTKAGRRLMVLGTPIKDEQGNIVRIVNASRDITQESQLQAELEEMKQLMEGYKIELQQLRQLTMQDEAFIAKSEQMRNILTMARKVAEVDSTVLILGESGVGKEVIASFIHHSSPRKDKPFIKVNCGAIPENLLESELFGYVKGAFTGASREGKLGLFELANEGTLFLDEIGEIPLNLQVKLLRVLQDNELVRLGGTKPVKINVRIVAATNRNLQEEIKKGHFREDLYYRLNVVPIYIPPLRERKDDILPLILHFIEKCNEKYKRNKIFSPTALDSLQEYEWPGNVRELQNIVERLIVTTDQNMVDIHHLPEVFVSNKQNQVKISVSGIMPLQEAIEMLEKQLLTLAKNKYQTTTKMAEALRVDQSTISRKMNRLGVL